jgi:hypothetical protein
MHTDAILLADAVRDLTRGQSGQIITSALRKCGVISEAGEP